MKLAKIILENNKYVVRVEIKLSDADVTKLAMAITIKLGDYLDIDDKTLLEQTVTADIGDLIHNNEI